MFILLLLHITGTWKLLLFFHVVHTMEQTRMGLSSKLAPPVSCNTSKMATSLSFFLVCFFSVWQVSVFSVFTCRGHCWGGGGVEPIRRLETKLVLFTHSCYLEHTAPCCGVPSRMLRNQSRWDAPQYSSLSEHLSATNKSWIKGTVSSVCRTTVFITFRTSLL